MARCNLLQTHATLNSLYNIMVANPEREYHTSQFWNYLLSKLIFHEKIYIITPEAPADGGRDRIDLTVKLFTPQRFTVLCYIEFKKPRASNSEIDKVEEQVFEACFKCCSGTDQTFVYAMAVVGGRARFFTFFNNSRSDCLVPFSGDLNTPDEDAYTDIGGDEGSLVIQRLERIKNNPPKHMAV